MSREPLEYDVTLPDNLRVNWSGNTPDDVQLASSDGQWSTVSCRLLGDLLLFLSELRKLNETVTREEE